ncbi:MAG: ArgR family transcriptional regulator [Prolixibacteraceae bacterium]
MKNRDERFELIKKIISNEVISNQDDLQLKLLSKGLEVTQATLSRDLKAMQVIKVSDSKVGYAYRLPTGSAINSGNMEGAPSRLNFLADGVLGIEFSGNLGVIKTLPGFASSTALAIDEACSSEILGTIAGDDTILLIIREGIGRSDVTKTLIGIMPKLENRL